MQFSLEFCFHCFHQHGGAKRLFFHSHCLLRKSLSWRKRKAICRNLLNPYYFQVPSFDRKSPFCYQSSFDFKFPLSSCLTEVALFVLVYYHVSCTSSCLRDLYYTTILKVKLSKTHVKKNKKDKNLLGFKVNQVDKRKDFLSRRKF